MVTDTILKEIETLSDEKKNTLFQFVMYLKQDDSSAEDMLDDVICSSIMAAYDADDSPDKHETMTLDDFATSVGVSL